MSKTTRRVYKIAAAAAFTAGSVAAIPATFAAEAPADQSGTTVAVTQHPNGEVNVEVTAPAPASTEAPKAEAPAPAATEAPKTEAPKAEAPAPAATEAPKTEETPKADPKTEQANPAIEIEETDFPADATINTITVRASGFQGG